MVTRLPYWLLSIQTEVRTTPIIDIVDIDIVIDIDSHRYSQVCVFLLVWRCYNGVFRFQFRCISNFGVPIRGSGPAVYFGVCRCRLTMYVGVYTTAMASCGTMSRNKIICSSVVPITWFHRITIFHILIRRRWENDIRKRRHRSSDGGRHCIQRQLTQPIGIQL